MTTRYLAKYPFSREAKVFLQEYGGNLDQIIKENPNLIQTVKERVSSALIGKTFENQGKTFADFLSYPLALAVVNFLNDPLLKAKFAVSESKKLYMTLLSEVNEENIVKLARETFNMDLIRRETVGGKGQTSGVTYYLTVEDYLKYSKRFKEPTWRLINRYLRKGFVEVYRRELIRIICEALKEKIMDKKIKVNLKGELREAALDLKKELERFRESKATWMKGRKGAEGKPPCIEDLMNKIKRNYDLSHVERLVVATYLLNTGYSVEETITVFSSLPDFDEEKTRYQVEHLGGLRGSKKKYSAPNCKTMQTYGLCKRNETCEGVNHPLQYRYRKRKEKKSR